MSGIDDLRRTLEVHADEVEVGGDLVRRTSVHHRIGAVRRRRRATVAGAAAAVVAVAAGVALLPGGDGSAGPGPAGPTVLGLDLPARISSLGFGYVYSDHVAGTDGRAQLRLAVSDEPRLVTWGTSGDDDAVRVHNDGDSDGTVTRVGPDFTDWVVVEAGQPGLVSASVTEGEVALAVYSIADERPAGVTAAGLTYREQIAGGHLLTAEVGAPGDADLTLAATSAGRGTKVVYACTGTDAEDLTLHTMTAGDEGESNGGIGCGEALPVDGLTTGAMAFTTAPGTDVTTRFWVTRGPDGPVVDEPGLRLAAAVYALDDDPLDSPAAQLETRGHTWRLTDTSTVVGGRSANVSKPTPAGAATLVVADIGAPSAFGSVTSELGESEQTNEVSAGGAARIDALMSGGTARLTVARGDASDYELNLSTYVRAD